MMPLHSLLRPALTSLALAACCLLASCADAPEQAPAASSSSAGTMPYRGADAHLFTPLPVDELPLPAGLDPDRLRAGGFALVPAEALWADAWHSLGGPAGQGPPADVDFSSEMLLFVAVADGAATPVEAAQGPDYVHVVFAPPSGQEGATLRLYRLPRTSSAVRVSPRRN